MKERGKTKRSWNPPTPADVENLVRSTGGGLGEFKNGFFCQGQLARSVHAEWELGFGRIKFPSVEYSTSYIKVPWNFSKNPDEIPLSTHPQVLLNFVESAWNLPRPKLLISVTGGATDFSMSGGDKV